MNNKLLLEIKKLSLKILVEFKYDVAVDLGDVQVETAVVVDGVAGNLVDGLQRAGGRRLDHVRQSLHHRRHLYKAVINL